MRVSDILRHKGSDVTTVRSDASIETASRQLADGGIGALVVSDDGTTIIGLLFERDVVRHVASAGRDALDAAVGSVMTTEVRTCSPTDSVEELMVAMTERRLRHIPVEESGMLCGVVSIGDVVERRLDELVTERQQLHEYIQTGR